ncbi:MAG: copper-binding protein [Pseudomonadota bacterium]
MNTISNIVLGLIAAAGASALATAADNGHTSPTAASVAAAPTTQGSNGAAIEVVAQPQSDGEIKKIDKEAGKMTVKHGPLVNLDMPPMTMVFRVKDPTMLNRVKAGDKVKFTVEKIDGAFIITALQAAT